MTPARQQALPAGDWRDLGTVFGQAVALAEAQGELAILLDDGSWKRLGEGGLSTGPSVPGSGQILAWGSVASALYAVRAVEGGTQGVTTRPPDAQGGMQPPPKRGGAPCPAPNPLQTPPSQTGAQRAFTAAGDTSRMVFLKDGKLTEQRYDPPGALNGSPSDMQAPQTNRPDPIVRILYSVMLLGMVVVMLVTFYRRRAVVEKKDEG